MIMYLKNVPNVQIVQNFLQIIHVIVDYLMINITHLLKKIIKIEINQKKKILKIKIIIIKIIKILKIVIVQKKEI